MQTVQARHVSLSARTGEMEAGNGGIGVSKLGLVAFLVLSKPSHTGCPL